MRVVRARHVLNCAVVLQGRGVVGTVLVRQGQLKLNNFFVAGGTWGRVRGLTDWLGRSTTKADPSTPVEVIGFKTKVLCRLRPLSLSLALRV